MSGDLLFCQLAAGSAPAFPVSAGGSLSCLEADDLISVS